MQTPTEVKSTRRADYGSTIWLSLVLLAAIVSRVFDLARESYWVDEIYTLFEGQQSIHQLLTSGRLDQPPAYYLPFHFWLQIFGTTEVSARSFSVLASLGSIILLYVVGRELFGNEVGLLGSLLMTVSSYQLFYAQEARFYAFYELTVVLSFLFLILALRHNKIVHFVLYGMASVAMIYSHTYGLFVLAAQNLFFLLQARKYRNSLRNWVICEALICLAVLPYVIPLVLGGDNVSTAIDYQFAKTYAVPSLLEPIRTVYRFIVAARDDRNWDAILATSVLAGVVLLAGTGLYAFRVGRREWVTAAKSWPGSLQEAPDLRGKLLLLSSWLLCPIMLPFIISLAVIPVYADKYMIGAAPAAYLLLAFGVSSLRKMIPWVASLGALAIVILPGLQYYYLQPTHQQWREAAAFVQERSGPADMIVFAGGTDDGIEQKSFYWYYKGPHQTCALSNTLIGFSAKTDGLLKCVGGYDRFWVVIRNSTAPPNTKDSFQYFFLNTHRPLLQTIQAHQFVDISVYQFALMK